MSAASRNTKDKLWPWLAHRDNNEDDDDDDSASEVDDYDDEERILLALSLSVSVCET